MPITGTLGTALTATTNPDPTTLATPIPVTARNTGSGQTYVLNPTFTGAGKLIVPQGKRVDGGDFAKIRLVFVPSNGAATTYTVTPWIFCLGSGTWVQVKGSPAVNYTGSNMDYINNPGYDPVWLQFSSISAGSLSVYFDPENMAVW